MPWGGEAKKSQDKNSCVGRGGTNSQTKTQAHIAEGQKGKAERSQKNKK